MLPEKQQKTTLAPAGVFLLVYSPKRFLVKISILFILFPFALSLNAQAIPESTAGVEQYFNAWYKEAVKKSKSVKKRKGIEKEVIDLYVTAVNGTVDETGNPANLERLRPPQGRFSLIQTGLNYRVFDNFPKEPGYNPLEYSKGWREIIDSLRWDTLSKEHVMDPVGVHPDRFRVPGLPLYEGRDKAIREFLEGDTAYAQKTNDGWPDDRSGLVRGKRFELLSGKIGLIEPHWGNRWIYRSFPIISDIYISKDATQALLNYRTHNGGGYAYYKKSKSGWILGESQITMMQ